MTVEERPPQPGDEVEVRGTAIRGELVSVMGASARVRRGTVTFEVQAEQLRRLGRPPAVTTSGAVPARASADESSPTELRLLGMRVHEAIAHLERFLDRAQGAGVASVRIVHGLGTGALKRAVTEYLARSEYCTRFQDAEPSEGGAGVTIAELL